MSTFVLLTAIHPTTGLPSTLAAGDLLDLTGINFECNNLTVNGTTTGVSAASVSDGTGTAGFQGAAGVWTTAGISTYDLDCSGALSLNSSGGAINIGNDAVAQAINFGTGGARTITYGNSGATLDFNGAGITVDGTTLSLDSTDTTNLSMTANDAGAKTLTVAASNAGAGVGNLALSSDGTLSLTDGTLTLSLLAGALSETGMTDLTLTGSGDFTITGATSLSVGDDVATWDFDGAGAVSETGMTSFAVTPSGAITLTGGAASTLSTTGGALTIQTPASSTWSVNGNDAGTLTLTIDAVNNGAGEGHLALSADDQVDISDSTGTLTFDGGAWSMAGFTTVDIDGSGAVSINSSGAAINIGNDAVAQGINIGTAGARTINLGNANAIVKVSTQLQLANADGSAPLVVGGWTSGAAVTQYAAVAVNGTAGKLFHADADGAGTLQNLLGIAQNSAAGADETLLVATGGVTNALFDANIATTDIGKLCYVSDGSTTAGALTLTPPTSSGDRQYKAGIVVGADASATAQILLQPQFIADIL